VAQNEPVRPLNTFVALALALVFVIGLGLVAWRVLTALDSAAAAAVITASATVLISVVSLLVSRNWEQRRAIEEAHREHKRAIYEDFMQFWFSTLALIPTTRHQRNERFRSSPCASRRS